MPHASAPSSGKALECKGKNIIDMALTFSAMLRVFSEQSKATITGQLEKLFAGLESINTAEDYEHVHADFCQWFAQTICSAERKQKNGRTIPSRPCSYGQAAKILDVAAKVYVYYCAQPSPETAAKIVPMLHCAVDKNILDHLRSLRNAGISSTSISDINRDEYKKAQAAVLRDISDNFHPEILLVEYDDIMWRRFSREQDNAGSKA